MSGTEPLPVLHEPAEPDESTAPKPEAKRDTLAFSVDDMFNSDDADSVVERSTDDTRVDGTLPTSALGEKALATVVNPEDDPGMFGRLRRIKHAIGRTAIGQAPGRIREYFATQKEADRRSKDVANRRYVRPDGDIVRGSTLHWESPRPQLQEADGVSLARKLALAVGSPASFDITDAHVLDPDIAQKALARLHKTGRDISPKEVVAYLRALDDELQERRQDGFLGDVVFDPKDKEALSIITRSFTLADQVHEARREYDILTSRNPFKRSAPKVNADRRSLTEYLATTDAVTKENVVTPVPRARQESTLLRRYSPAPDLVSSLGEEPLGAPHRGVTRPREVRLGSPNRPYRGRQAPAPTRSRVEPAGRRPATSTATTRPGESGANRATPPDFISHRYLERVSPI